MKIFTTKLLGLVISALLLGACSQMATYENEDLTNTLAKSDQSGFTLSPYETTRFENAMVSESGDFILTYTENVCLGDDILFTFGGTGFTGNRTVQVQEFVNDEWVQVFQQSQASSGASGNLSGYEVGTYLFRWKVAGQGGVQNVEFTVEVEDCNVSCEYETGYVGNTIGETEPAQGNGNNNAWWYAFDIEGPTTQNVYQKNNVIGTAVYDENAGTITINFDSSYSLKEGESESVKWSSYADGLLPTGGRPTPGQSLNKGTDLVIDTNGDRYYVIHLDVQVCTSAS
ncbi:hypothetical protein [Algoriphagus halophilus]|uniref:Lipoprotein n=1 Tax=Algoriphagus halophilus TaxID=226505 RepID=A0A1N6FTY7_9BACT|nr:hypothetical protein [Algoriphagus halophilus]SIN98779.1 hypothetical protein SAMN05444394_2728 [Algoriphagus halophilus]